MNSTDGVSLEGAFVSSLHYAIEQGRLMKDLDTGFLVMSLQPYAADPR